MIKFENNIFTLTTDNTSYQMQISEHKHLLHLYYGKKIEGSADYLLKFYDRGFSGNPYDAGEDRTYSMDALPQEYPSYGNGDYRTSALIIQNSDGSYSSDMRYESYEIRKGLTKIKGMPSAHAKEGGETLIITLKDRYNDTKVELIYAVIEEQDLITRSARIINSNKSPITINRAFGMSVDYLYGSYDLIHFYGRHGMERCFERQPLIHGNLEIGSRRGTSSHQHNPFIILAQSNTNEENGECYGFSFVYSGNFKAIAEKDQYEQTRVQMGLSDEMLAWKLESGECFDTPQVLMTFSDKGLTALSHKFHAIITENICIDPYKGKRRPILINNWEATYFDFTGEKIIEIAKEAAELGIEMLVLDDGWFGKRDSDNSGLGDWVVNEEKLGQSLKEVADKIKACGLKFGLWIEPEMVNEDSDLFRAHPDWAYTIPGRKPIRARNQLVLDFSRKEIVDYIYEKIAAIIEAAGVDYIKMDMNRHLTDIYSCGEAIQNQGVILHKYVLGVYDFLQRLIDRFPNLLIEGCSGGGGRFDAGMLYYTPQIWCSDNTDAIERLSIQYGTSFGYPCQTVGAHVSAVPNHQTGRITEIDTRAAVAMAGTFGYELDPSKLSKDEKESIRKQIEIYKKNWQVIANGQYYRLTDINNTKMMAWALVTDSECMLTVVATESRFNPAQHYIRLKGLEENTIYINDTYNIEETGSILMNAGIPIPRLKEYEAWQITLKKR